MVDRATMVGSGGQESFLCRHCWSTALTFVKGALQSLRQLHWALATGCQSCGKKRQSFYYLQHLPAKNPRRAASHHWLEEGAIDTWLHRLSPKRPCHETLGFMRGNIFGAEPSTLDEVFICLSPWFSGGKSHKRVPWQ